MKYPDHIVTAHQKELYDDFVAFATMLFQSKGFVSLTPVQQDIACYMQHGPSYRIVQAYRGVGKSVLSEAYALWRLYRDPQIKVLVISGGSDRAEAFTKACLEQISHPKAKELRFLAPQSGQRTSSLNFDVGPARETIEHSASMRAVGIGGQTTGFRADLIISDDVEIPENCFTQNLREKLQKAVGGYSALLKSKGEILVLGTPQISESLYSEKGLLSRGYSTRIWPAHYTDGKSNRGTESTATSHAPMLRTLLASEPKLNGKRSDTRYTESELRDKRTLHGNSEYQLQYMLNTTLSDADRYPLRTSDLILMDVGKELAPITIEYGRDPKQLLKLPNVGLSGDKMYSPMTTSDETKKFNGSVMLIDPSGRGSDRTAYCITRELSGKVFIAEWNSIDGGYETETLEALCEEAKKHQVNLILVESNFGDGMYLSLLSPVLHQIYPCTLDEYRVSGSKEKRIISKLEPVLNGHRLVLDRGVAERDSNTDGKSIVHSGLYQLTHLTKDKGSLKHDDLVDVLGESVGYWTKALKTDEEEAKRRHIEKLRDRDINDFMSCVKGRGHRNRSRVVRVSSGGTITRIQGTRNW